MAQTPPSSQGNAAPADASGAGPTSPAKVPVAVSANCPQLQLHPPRHQHRQQPTLSQTQQSKPQQFVPGPFYNLQQQQAFAQARFAAATSQQQQQQQQRAAPNAQLHATQTQTQQQQHRAGYPFVLQQQQTVTRNVPATGETTGLHSTTLQSAATVVALPVLNYSTINNIAGDTSSSFRTATAVEASVTASKVSKKRKQSSLENANAASSDGGISMTKKVPSPNKSAIMPQKSIELPKQPIFDMSSTAAQLIQNAMAESNSCDIPASSTSPVDASSVGDNHNNHRPPTAAEKKQSSRDRNREHARCTRLRKKAYVNKLKELVDGLHTERNEDARRRRVAAQQFAETQELRRKVVNTFLEYHSRYERDQTKWSTILEKDFWLKQPVTPYRSFRRCEIHQGSRILKGVDAMICDSASMSIMIETIGSRNLRWMHRKRDDFLTRDASKHALARGGRMMARRISSLGHGSGGGHMPHSIDRGNNRLQHAMSSLSSSGWDTGNGSSAEEERHLAKKKKTRKKGSGGHRDVHHGSEEKGRHDNSTSGGDSKKVISSSCGSDDALQLFRDGNYPASNDFHDYHAPSLPDPLPELGDSSIPSSDSPQDIDSDNCVVGKQMCTDSSSCSEEKESSNSNNVTPQKKRQFIKGENNLAAVTAKPLPVPDNLPINIARTGGIQHSVTVPQVASHGKTNTSHHNEEERNDSSSNIRSSRGNIITIDNEYTSASTQSSSQSRRGIRADYHVNEDDMIITDGVLMCPFIFRSQDAVWCGALAECVQPGMLRATFSKTTNKLRNVEMIFDAMGFCQQLERASGNEGMAQIVPNCLEMALGTANSDGYAKVITLAKGTHFKIVSVNEAFTRVTGYTQLDVEGKDLRSVLSKGGEGETEDELGARAGTTMHDFDPVAKKGVCAASTNEYFDAKGRDFLAFMCSYPLSNLRNEVTHILHVCQELPDRE